MEATDLSGTSSKKLLISLPPEARPTKITSLKEAEHFASVAFNDMLSYVPAGAPPKITESPLRMVCTDDDNICNAVVNASREGMDAIFDDAKPLLNLFELLSAAKVFILVEHSELELSFQLHNLVKELGVIIEINVGLIPDPTPEKE